jgi:HEAT repeat protein
MSVLTFPRQTPRRRAHESPTQPVCRCAAFFVAASRFVAGRMLALGLVMLATGMNIPPALAQVDYSVHFEMEKPDYSLREPIFCRFVIRNTGSRIFAFRYRTPTRALGSDNDQEPRFVVTNASGRRLADPGPRPCGSPQGTTVYGYVTLPAGKVHTERWLLNQWAQFVAPGTYHVRAQRRLALLAPDAQTGKFADKPAAFALALDELSVTVGRSNLAAVKAAFQPYLDAVANPKDPNPAEAVVVLTAMPQPYFLDRLVAMANAAKPERWDRRDAVDGLARLNTPASWQAILKLFREAPEAATAGSKNPAAPAEDPVWSYALLLLAEKGDTAFIPTLLAALAKSGDPMRGDILRALGFFRDARAYQPLFENLHSAQVTDRMNAILGLKNSGTKEVIPALLAALNDPDAQVRQVANFALEGVTGYRVAVSASPSTGEWQRVADRWHAWWREHAGSFTPARPAACHDW